MQELLRQIPPVHEVQKMEGIVKLQKENQLDNNLITNWIQQEINDLRDLILASKDRKDSITGNMEDRIVQGVERRAIRWLTPSLRRVINGTGTILHTNLGRAPLSKEAIEQVVEVSSHYSNLEYQLDVGKRGSRHSIIESLLQEITGAEACMVVNNNAAAVYLILRALAKDKEVIVSRGELVEIGGSFRVSAIMDESDAKLIEVGTTNKTHLYDFEGAINEDTAMLMKVHTSNFKIIGFTESVPRDKMIQLAHDQQVIYYEDLGSGAIYNYEEEGIGDEPAVRKVIDSGADVVSFSGDKLLGGPQSGIIAGKKQIIDRLKKHQLARVLRVDKMTFAALEATLKAYLKGKEHRNKIPVIQNILKKPHDIEVQVEDFLSSVPTTYINMEKVSLTSQIGGGTMPEVELESVGIKLNHPTASAHQLEACFRSYSIPIIGRILDQELYFDFRTLTVDDLLILQKAVLANDQKNL
ncbi:L-seryl-tRNA(Sec) selenium transferase [Bacillaceae bacterium S4-13-58]